MIETLHIPQASEIDYTSEGEICGYQLLLCKIFECAGGFDLPRRTNATQREVRTQGLVWLGRVEQVIREILESSAPAGMRLSAIPRILDSYDLFYRICNGTPAFDRIRRARLKTADLWVKGDRSISQTDMVLGLLREADRDSRTLERRYSQYAFEILGEWIDELQACGKFRNIPLHEAYDRLNYLLSDDLFLFLGRTEQPRIKAQWIRSYALADAQLDRLCTKDLWSYIPFAQTVSRSKSLPLSAIDAEYARLFKKLATRPDLHPFCRDGIAIELARYKTA